MQAIAGATQSAPFLEGKELGALAPGGYATAIALRGDVVVKNVARVR